VHAENRFPEPVVLVSISQDHLQEDEMNIDEKKIGFLTDVYQLAACCNVNLPEFKNDFIPAIVPQYDYELVLLYYLRGDKPLKSYSDNKTVIENMLRVVRYSLPMEVKRNGKNFSLANTLHAEHPLYLSEDHKRFGWIAFHAFLCDLHDGTPIVDTRTFFQNRFAGYGFEPLFEHGQPVYISDLILAANRVLGDSEELVQVPERFSEKISKTQLGLHLNRFWGEKEARHYVEKLINLYPDLIVDIGMKTKFQIRERTYERILRDKDIKLPEHVAKLKFK